MTEQEKHFKNDNMAARIATFWTVHEKKLSELYKDYIEDTEDNLEKVEFVCFIYHNAQDLVVDPNMN